MTEIKKGLSVDLSSVGAVEKDGKDTIIYIDGRSFTWAMEYTNALALVDQARRMNGTITVP